MLRLACVALLNTPGICPLFDQPLDPRPIAWLSGWRSVPIRPDLHRIVTMKFRRAIKEFGQHIGRDAERELAAALLTKSDERQYGRDSAARDANDVPGVGSSGAELHRRADDAGRAARDNVG